MKVTPILAISFPWDRVVSQGLRIALIIGLAFISYLIIHRAVPKLIRTALFRGQGERLEEEVAKRADTLSHVLVRTGAVAIIIMIVFMVLAELGINITPILAGAGIAGIALGLGAQSLVKDIITGFFIIIENQYGKGDVVRVAGIAGLVEDINLRRTVLRDLDGIVHSIPNGEITTSSNFTRDWSRVNLNIPIAYKEDIDHVIQVLNRVGEELAKDEVFGLLITEPPQVLRVDNFAESSIEIKMLGTTKPIRQWDVMGELRKRIKKAFDEEGIEIPYPHRVVIDRSQ
ncbi:MAG: mechanosensitive ion channel family protein [Chloroflexi bacterium]|nr:mechanosensitive ion channel family protein [Chloroflexota bacterium]